MRSFGSASALTVLGLALLASGCGGNPATTADSGNAGTSNGSKSPAREAKTRIAIYDVSADKGSVFEDALPARIYQDDDAKGMPAGAVVAVAMTPDGMTLAAARKAGPVELLDPISLTKRTSHPGFGPLASAANRALLAFGLERAEGVCLALHPAGEVLAVGRDGIKLVEIATAKLLDHLQDGHKSPIQAMAFSPSGKLLVSVSGHEVTLWDFPDAKPVVTFPLPDFKNGDGATSITERPRPTRLAFTPDGQWVLTASAGYPVVTWFDSARGKDTKQFLYRQAISGPSGLSSSLTSFTAVAFSPDGAMLAAAHQDDDLRLWEVVTGKLLGRAAGQAKGLTPTAHALTFSPDGTLLFGGCLDGTVRRWEVKAILGN